MAYNDQQIADYAHQLEAKGAPPSDIEGFVKSAKSEQLQADGKPIPANFGQMSSQTAASPPQTSVLGGALDMVGNVASQGLDALHSQAQNNPNLISDQIDKMGVSYDKQAFQQLPREQQDQTLQGLQNTQKGNMNPLGSVGQNIGEATVNGIKQVAGGVGGLIQAANPLPALSAFKDQITGNYRKDAQGNMSDTVTPADLQAQEQSQKGSQALTSVANGITGIATAPISGALNSIPDDSMFGLGAPIKQVIGALGNIPSDLAGTVGYYMAKSANPNLSEEQLQKQVVEPIKAATNLGLVAGVGSGKAGEIVDNVKGKVDEGYQNAVKNEWSRPATTNTRGFNNAQEIYNNAQTLGHDIGENLTNKKLDPKNYIDNGNFNTKDLAETIHTDASKMSTDTLRPALEKFNDTIPKVDQSVILNKALAEARKSNLVNKADIIADIKSEFADTREGSLSASHPDGFNLTDMHDAKIKYSQGVYDALKPAKNTANRFISTAFKDVLEQKAPKSIGVAEFNKVLQGEYKTSEYLDALNGKKAPQTLKQKIASKAAKAAGAAIGEHLTGGVSGGYAGYIMGGALESFLEKLPNPLRKSALENLKVSNPAAFEAVQKVMAGPNPQLLLPEPSPGSKPMQYSSGPTIPLGSKSPSTIDASERARLQNNPST